MLLGVAVVLVLGTGCTHKPYGKGSMRPYTIRGHNYRPTYVTLGQKMRGISSWYGPNFHGKRTSNGERYDMHAMTAAHKTWPMNTMLRVTNLENHRSVVVRINDRGPFVRGRIIDCSYEAGRRIGLDKRGIAKVEIEVIGFGGRVEPARRVRPTPKAPYPSTPPQRVPRPHLMRVKLSHFAIQLGAFGHYEGAKVYQRRYGSVDPRYKPRIKRTQEADGRVLYRVWLSGFRTQEEAEVFRSRHDLGSTFIVSE